jgi:hypothetical protein
VERAEGVGAEGGRGVAERLGHEGLAGKVEDHGGLGRDDRSRGGLGVAQVGVGLGHAPGEEGLELAGPAGEAPDLVAPLGQQMVGEVAAYEAVDTGDQRAHGCNYSRSSGRGKWRSRHL